MKLDSKIILFLAVFAGLIGLLMITYNKIVSPIIEEKKIQLGKIEDRYIAELHLVESSGIGFEESSSLRNRFILSCQSLPESTNELIDEIHSMISGGNLKITKITSPEIKINQSDKNLVTFEMTTVSGFHDFAVFCMNIADSSFPIHISDLDVSRSKDDDDLIQCSFRISSFVWSRQ